jgi:3'(2'), 5'-bisphosphate nucleotidase
VTANSGITPAQAERLLDGLTAIVSKAAAATLAVPAADVARRLKADQSHVTAADEASEAIILEGLARLLPQITVVSEEAASRTAPPKLGASFILLDPLDGTKEFLAGRDEFTINLAILTNGNPVAGIVAAPALGLVWRGVVGQGAERLKLKPGSAPEAASERAAIRTRAWPAQNPLALVSRSHLNAATEDFLKRLPGVRSESRGSSVKFCQVAEGGADIYARLSPQSEWDIAAGHAVLIAAGGVVTKPDRAPLVYGGASTEFRIPGFLAWGDASKAKTIVAG